jgi:hypothetical protein
MEDDDLRDFTSDCHCRVCIATRGTEDKKTSIFEGYSSTTIATIGLSLSDHQFMLCPYAIPVFVFQTRTWGEYTIPMFTSKVGEG